MSANVIPSELTFDDVIPPQPSRRVVNTGEKRLMLAVLDDAWRSALNRPTFVRDWDDRMYPWKQDEAWIMATDWDYVFSFVNICETLELNPKAVREAYRKRRDAVFVVR